MSGRVFHNCSSFLISGATGSGKTQWIYKFLRHLKKMFPQTPRAILYCYGIHQKLFEEMKSKIPNLKFHSGLPSMKDLEDLSRAGQNSLLILDDLMTEVSDTGERYFTQGTHHLGISVMYVTQNLFHQGKRAHYQSECSKYDSL